MPSFNGVSVVGVPVAAGSRDSILIAEMCERACTPERGLFGNPASGARNLISVAARERERKRKIREEKIGYNYARMMQPKRLFDFLLSLRVVHTSFCIKQIRCKSYGGFKLISKDSFYFLLIVISYASFYNFIVLGQYNYERCESLLFT